MSGLVTTTVAIGGMTCANCVESITNMVTDVPGVESVEVSLMTETGVIKHSSLVDEGLIRETIEDCGFEAKLVEQKFADEDDALLQIRLRVFGMTCSNCSSSIETAVSELPGVKSCKVSLTTEELDIMYNSNSVGIRDIIQLIEDCGFDALLNSNLDLNSQLDALSKKKEVQYWRLNFLKCLIVGGPVVVFGHLVPSLMKKHHKMMSHSIGPTIVPGIYLDHICEFVLTSYLQFFIGKKFYINSWKSIKHGSGTMDLLITISTTILYVYSVFSMIYAMFEHASQAPEVLFPTTAMLFIFISLGKWLENKAKGQTSNLLSKLLSLTPPTCHLVKNFNPDLVDIETETIAVELLQKNDILLIKPGSKIPSDGVVIFGEGEVDESLLTGESMPVYKTKGSTLIGGSVNSNNAMYLKVTHIGESTQLQQIVKLVKDAQMTKAPIQRYADLIASKFVPLILLLSVSTFCLWFSIVWLYYVENWEYPSFLQDEKFRPILQIAISVIVVLCPCALGLAAPTLIMVGTGLGASNGILIKSGEFLEIAKKINYILFDKTGTLTSGDFNIKNYKFNSTKFSAVQIWNFVKLIEQNSEHPIGKSLYTKGLEVSRDDEDDVLIKELNFQSSLGVESSLIFQDQLVNVKLGNERMMKQSDLSDRSEYDNVLKTLKLSSMSLTHVVIDNEYVGYIELEDSIKEELILVLMDLRSKGYEIGMCTGDNYQSLIQVGNKLSIAPENIFFEKSPIDKSDVIKSLQGLGRYVSFIGDGTNDAPLLIQSDLGILISTGTDVAIESADVVLLENSLDNVVSTLDISIKTFNRIKLNFVWAMLYNVIMLPFAMGFFIIPFGIILNPMYASLCMAFSSISVVISSLMLKRWTPPRRAEVKMDDNELESQENSTGFLQRLLRRGKKYEYIELENVNTRR